MSSKSDETDQGDLNGAETCKRIRSAGIVFVRKNPRSGRLEVLLIKRHQRLTYKLSKAKLQLLTREEPLEAALRASRSELGLAPAAISMFGLDSVSNLKLLQPQRYIYRSPHTRARLHKTVTYFAFYMRRQLRRILDERDIFPSKLREWKTTELRWMDRAQVELAALRGKASPNPLHNTSLVVVLREVFDLYSHKENQQEVQTKRSALAQETGIEDDSDLPSWLREARRQGTLVAEGGSAAQSPSMTKRADLSGASEGGRDDNEGEKARLQDSKTAGSHVQQGESAKKNNQTDDTKSEKSSATRRKRRSTTNDSESNNFSGSGNDSGRSANTSSDGTTSDSSDGENTGRRKDVSKKKTHKKKNKKKHRKKEKSKKRKKKDKKSKKHRHEAKDAKRLKKALERHLLGFAQPGLEVATEHGSEDDDASSKARKAGLLVRARAGPYTGPPAGTNGINDFFCGAMFARNNFK
eukprot:INCI1571.2.p1 GENE.INCI1571.2~~INCI1571.2.p1  ORF type:complete len:514 (-),score=117.30 INCI1571.2:350-1753(-)